MSISSADYPKKHFSGVGLFVAYLMYRVNGLREADYSFAAVVDDLRLLGGAVAHWCLSVGTPHARVGRGRASCR